MKKMTIMMLAIVLMLASFQALADKDVLTVALSPDFSPMEFIDTSKTGDDQYVGFDVFLAKFIAEELGMTLQIKPMSFDACQTAVQVGAVDMSISGYSWTAERAENYNLSDYYYAGDNETEQVIITKAELAGTFTSAESFSGKTVAAQAASLQMDLCLAQLPGTAVIKEYKVIDDAVLALMSGKVDAVAVAKGNGDAIIANNSAVAMSGFEFVVSAEAENNVIMIQKGNDELLAKVNAALAKAYEAGHYSVWYAEAEALAGIETSKQITYDEEGKPQ
jgi:polar amino acid transport system substrate-binding protein